MGNFTSTPQQPDPRAAPLPNQNGPGPNAGSLASAPLQAPFSPTAASSSASSAAAAVPTAIHNGGAIPIGRFSRPLNNRNSTESPMFGSPLSTPIHSGIPPSYRPSVDSSMDEDTPKATYPSVISWNHGGNEVQIVGAFNNWKESIPLSRSHDDFNTVVNLPAGTYEFKFIVDGELRCSTDFPTVLDQKGNLINYVELGPDVEESFDAPGNASKSNMDEDEVFSQEIPSGMNEKEPPKLPPHLNKVILNSENSTNDPTVLPVPHHVMLNHLYALSIRDRVMVLATTSRYQQKYVTTVLYKPVFT